MDLKFIVSGVQYENGVESTALTMVRSFFRAGAEVFVYKNYLSTIHGGTGKIPGTAYYEIRVSDKKIYCSGDDLCDILIVLEFGRKKDELPVSATNYLKKIKRGGILLYDSSLVGPIESPDFVSVGIPAYSMVKEAFPQEKETKLNLIRNSILTGVAFELFGFDRGDAIVKSVMEKQFGAKGDLLKKNLLVFKSGRTYIGDRPFMPYQEPIVPRPSQRKRLFLSGNDAMSLSAINSGASLYTGYPITPASPILEFMEKNLRDFGGVSLQCEDEIAAAMAALGASYGGANALDATSGPGFSLKIETIGHSGMSEVGMVIINVQRAGPSTGMPTKTEQSDLMLAIFGHHGEIPKIVLAPGDVKEFFEVMPRAFYLARKYQMPVIILTSLDVAEGWSTTEEFDLSYADKFNYDWKPQEKIGQGVLHERYADSESGISPVSIPGERDKVFKMGGAEHDQYGFVTTKPVWRKTIMDKRMRKMKTFLKEDFRAPVYYGRERNDVALIGWGTTKGILLETKERLEVVKDISVGVVHFIDMWPMKPGVASKALASARKVFVVEGNATGEFASVLRLKASEDGFPVSPANLSSVLFYDGRPIEPRTIVNTVLGKEG